MSEAVPTAELGQPVNAGRRAAMAIAVSGIVVCLGAAALAPDPKLLEPLTLLLAVTALVATLAYVDVEGTLLADSSFVPFMLAAAFLGPTAVVGVAASSELATWLMYRYRREALLVNLLATCGPLLLASTLLALVADREGPAFYAVLAAAGALELVLNAFLVVSLIGLVDGRTLSESVRGWRKIVAPFLFNILLAIAAASVYTNLGALAVLVVLAIVIAFRYLVAQVFSARHQATEIAALASSRGKLVAQTLDAEDREKRRLSEALHDGPLQHLLSAAQDLGEARAGQADGIARASDAIAAAISELRNVVFELHPVVLTKGGLIDAVEAVALQEGSRAGFRPIVDIDPAVVGLRDRLVFSTVRELLINVARHAAATQARVSIARRGDDVIVSVNDDGRGLSHDARALAVQRGHLGLASIEERAEAVGGRLELETVAAQGTRITVVIPSGSPGVEQSDSARVSQH